MTLYPNDLFSLADALQMELFINKNAVSGKVVRPVSIPELGMKINLQLKVLSSRATTSEGELSAIALLIHVAGDLYMLVQNDLFQATVTVMLMNGAKLPAKPALEEYFSKDKRQLKTIMPMFEKAKVASFSRAETEKTWKPALAA